MPDPVRKAYANATIHPLLKFAIGTPITNTNLRMSLRT
jgi:hypothetical protein